MGLDEHSTRRRNDTVRGWERRNRTPPIPAGKRRNTGGSALKILAVKPTADVAPGDTVDCGVYEDESPTGDTQEVRHVWGDTAPILSGTEQIAVQLPGWSYWVFIPLGGLSPVVCELCNGGETPEGYQVVISGAGGGWDFANGTHVVPHTLDDMPAGGADVSGNCHGWVLVPHPTDNTKDLTVFWVVESNTSGTKQGVAFTTGFRGARTGNAGILGAAFKVLDTNPNATVNANTEIATPFVHASWDAVEGPQALSLSVNLNAL